MRRRSKIKWKLIKFAPYSFSAHFKCSLWLWCGWTCIKFTNKFNLLTNFKMNIEKLLCRWSTTKSKRNKNKINCNDAKWNWICAFTLFMLRRSVTESIRYPLSMSRSPSIQTRTRTQQFHTSNLCTFPGCVKLCKQKHCMHANFKYEFHS